MASSFPSRTLPDSVEQHLVDTLLSDAARQQFKNGNIANQELAEAVRLLTGLSSGYNTHEVGETLARPVGSLAAAQAYALYYLSINAAKLAHLFERMKLPERVRVLDFGSGPGTTGMALLSTLPIHLELHCIEASRWMREAAQQLLPTFKGTGELLSLTQTSSLEVAAPGQFDLVVAANVLAELKTEDRARLRRALIERVAPDGYLVLVEPGQPHHTRHLMTERNAIISESGGMAPIYPCLRSDDCPMLRESTEDWCHATINWNRGQLARQLDDLLGFNKHRVKFSAFVFQRTYGHRPGYRILTVPEKGPRGVEALVCGADFYGTVRISKRNRSASNRTFEKMCLFDRILSSSPMTSELNKDDEIREIPWSEDLVL